MILTNISRASAKYLLLNDAPQKLRKHSQTLKKTTSKTSTKFQTDSRIKQIKYNAKIASRNVLHDFDLLLAIPCVDRLLVANGGRYRSRFTVQVHIKWGLHYPYKTDAAL